MDSFTPGRGIPSCQLAAKWIGQGRPSELSHKVTLMGAKEPSNFFRIVLGYDAGTWFLIANTLVLSNYVVIYCSHAARRHLTSTSSDTSVEYSQGK